MTNEEVLECVKPFYAKDNPDGAAEKLVVEASLAWQRVVILYIQESYVRDDITCIVIFLH